MKQSRVMALVMALAAGLGVGIMTSQSGAEPPRIELSDQDTDGDGASDKLEAKYGQDPLVADDHPVVFEIDAQIAEPGRKISVYGMQFPDTIDKTKLSIRTQAAVTEITPSSVDRNEIVFTVPANLPGGVGDLTVGRIEGTTLTPDIPPLVYSSPSHFFWTPTNPKTQVAEQKPGPSRLPCKILPSATCFAVGKIRNTGDEDGYYLDLKSPAMATINLEAVAPKDFTLAVGNTPDLQLIIRDSIGRWIASSDDISERTSQNLNARIERFRLTPGRYRFNAAATPKATATPEQLAGFYRLSVKLDTAPWIFNLNPALGGAGDVMELSGFNFAPEPLDNLVQFVRVEGGVETDSYPAVVLGASCDRISVAIPSEPALSAPGNEFRVKITTAGGDNTSCEEYKMLEFWTFTALTDHRREQWLLPNFITLDHSAPIKVVGHFDRAVDRSEFILLADPGQKVQIEVQLLAADGTTLTNPNAIDPQFNLLTMQDNIIAPSNAFAPNTTGRVASYDDLPPTDQGRYRLMIGANAAGPQERYFRLTISDQTRTIAVDRLEIIAGNNQSVFEGTSFATKLQVRASFHQTPVENAKVLFSWSGGSYVTTTNSDGIATLDDMPDPPARGGRIDIFASIPGQNRPMNKFILVTKDLPFRFSQTDPNSDAQDFDNDGISNAEDEDDDNDGGPDVSDSQPFNPGY